MDRKETNRQTKYGPRSGPKTKANGPLLLLSVFRGPKRDVGGLGGRTAGTADPGEKHKKKNSPSRVFSRGLRTATA